MLVTSVSSFGTFVMPFVTFEMSFVTFVIVIGSVDGPRPH